MLSNPLIDTDFYVNIAFERHTIIETDISPLFPLNRSKIERMRTWDGVPMDYSTTWSW